MVDYNTVARRKIGVLVERRALDNPWQDHAWDVIGVLAEAPDTPAWTEIARSGSTIRYYAGAATLELFPLETETLQYNLGSQTPQIFVTLRRCEGERDVELFAATACTGTAEAMTEAGDDIVRAVPMPGEIAAWVADFAARHHVEQPKFKRKRDRHDAESLARRPGGRGGE